MSNFGDPTGPDRNRLGSPDWYAAEKWKYDLGRNTRVLGRLHKTQPGGSEQRAGSALSGLFGIVVALLIVAGKVPIGTAVLLLIVVGVVWAMRKFLFRLIGAVVVLYGLYVLLMHR